MIEIKEGRTNTYRATVEMENGKPINDGGYVKQLRELISAKNKAYENRSWRVKLRGRGSRIKAAKSQGATKWQAKVWYRQDLPLALAERADVYVYETTRYWS